MAHSSTASPCHFPHQIHTRPLALQDPLYQSWCLFGHTTLSCSMLVHFLLSLCICVKDCLLASHLAPSAAPTSSVTLPLSSHCPSDDHVTHQSLCPILTSDPNTGLSLVGAIIRVRVPLVIFDHAQLGGVLGYLIIPSAVWILSLISED